MTDRDPDLVSRYPGWVRPSWWKWPEDWASPAWERRMSESGKRRAEELAQIGFEVCPRCHVQHTGLTLVCRECGWSNKKRDVTGGEGRP